MSEGFHTLQSMRSERIFAIGKVRWIPTKHSQLQRHILMINVLSKQLTVSTECSS